MITAVIFKEDEMIISCGTYNKTRPKVNKQCTIPYPAESFVNGEILDVEKLSKAIQQEIKKEKIKGKALLFGIEHSQINIIEMSVPYVKGKIMQAVNVKLSERFIGIAEENYISYKISRIEGNMCHGMASVVPHRILDKYYELSLNIGLPLKAVDFIGNIFYKSIHLEDKNLANHTFIVAETTASEVTAHLYHDGVLKNSRSEHGNSILMQEEPIADDFVFQNRLTFTEEDITCVMDIFTQVKQGLDDLYAIRSTIEIFFHRFKNTGDAGKAENAEKMEAILKRIDESLIDIRALCDRTLDFDENGQKQSQKFFHELMMRMQKLSAEFKDVGEYQSSMVDGIEEILTAVKQDVQAAMEIFDRYVMNDVDQKKYDRRLIMKNICKIVNQTIVMADMSQNFGEIETLFVEGMQLDQNEKKLIEQNLGKFYDIKVRNYESGITDTNRPYLGIYYNDFAYFKDLDLAAAMEKNDRVNRNNYDNILLGIGGCMVFGVICIFGLWGYSKYEMYRMNQIMIEDTAYIEKNKNIDDIVTREETLRNQIEEIKKFQEYFTLANVDMNKIYEELSDLSDKVEILDISIDSNFIINLKLRSKTLENISSYMEILNSNDYKDAAYDTVTLGEDGKYLVTARYHYVP